MPYMRKPGRGIHIPERWMEHCPLSFLQTGHGQPQTKRLHGDLQDDDYFSHEDYYYDYEDNKAAYQKGFRSKLKLISRHCSRKGKLLDIGAAYGFFMEEAARYGFEPYGVELSAKAAGIPFVAYNNPVLEADAHINSLKEIDAILKG